MPSFKDTKGREWRLEGNFASYGRVKDQTGVKLYDIATESRDSLVQLTDVLTLGKVLWAMVEPQAEARGVSPEDFAESFDVALLDTMVFFCHPRQRMILERAVKKLREVETKAGATVTAKLDEFDLAIDEAIDQWTRGFLAGSSPASSASTPASGPSESCSTPPEGDGEKSGTTPVRSSPRCASSTATRKSGRGRMTRPSSTR
jgi:hypothetical protein